MGKCVDNFGAVFLGLEVVSTCIYLLVPEAFLLGDENKIVVGRVYLFVLYFHLLRQTLKE